jgi:hypothetical protein
MLDTFTPAAGFLYIDCSGVTMPGVYTLPVKIDMPRGFSLSRYEPEEMSLIITRKEEEAD